MQNLNNYFNYIATQKVRRPEYKIDLLHKEDDSIIGSITGAVEDSSGSISISNQDGSRRSASFTINNYLNQWQEYFKYLSIGQRFKVYLGYNINNDAVWFPQGVFVYTDPTLQSEGANTIISISGNDKWSLLDGTAGGILDATFQVPAGTSMGKFKLDIVKDYTTPNIDESVFNAVTTYDIIHSAGETVADVILEVAANLSCYAYYDENGIFTMRPFDYDDVLSPVYEYTYNDINYIGASKVLPISQIYNSVLIVSDNLQNANAPIVASLDNNDVTDINSVINGATRKVYNVTDNIAGIYTQQQADERARYELKKVACMQSTISLTSMPLYHLRENEVITVTDPYLGCNGERFLISGINFSISHDSNMTVDLVKTTKYLQKGCEAVQKEVKELNGLIEAISKKMVDRAINDRYLISRMAVIVNEFDAEENAASIIIPTDLEHPTTYKYPNRTGRTKLNSTVWENGKIKTSR